MIGLAVFEGNLPACDHGDYERRGIVEAEDNKNNNYNIKQQTTSNNGKKGTNLNWYTCTAWNKKKCTLRPCRKCTAQAVRLANEPCDWFFP